MSCSLLKLACKLTSKSTPSTPSERKVSPGDAEVTLRHTLASFLSIPRAFLRGKLQTGKGSQVLLGGRVSPDCSLGETPTVLRYNSHWCLCCPEVHKALDNRGSKIFVKRKKIPETVGSFALCSSDLALLSPSTEAEMLTLLCAPFPFLQQRDTVCSTSLQRREGRSI